jgi:hypothetical protein
MKVSIPRPVSVPLPAYGEETGVQNLSASERHEGNPGPLQASWRKMTGDSIKQSLGLPERAYPRSNQELRSGAPQVLVAANKGSLSVRADGIGEGVGIEGGYTGAGVGRRDERSGDGSSGGNDGQREDTQGGNQSHVNARRDSPAVDVSAVNAADSNADAAPVIYEDAHAVKSRWVRAELSIPMGTTGKVSAQESRSGTSHALVAASTGSPLARANDSGDGLRVEGRRTGAGVGRRDERSGDGSSGGNDGQREDSQSGNQSHVNGRIDTPAVNVPAVKGADSDADAAQVICEGAYAVQSHRVRAELSIAIGTRYKLPATKRAHLQSESVAVLIEELLRVSPADVNKPLPLSHSTRPQSLPRANAAARRRIQQALAVTDGIVIIATRTSQNDPEQHRQRSLLDALVDLLYMLVDLLNPVVDLMDTAARQAAWSQLKQLAFLTPYTGKLRGACDSAISLLGEEI